MPLADPLHLTFDDGPDPEWTPRVLRRLEAHGITATFYVLGARVRSAPHLVDMIGAAGHQIGLHGDEHLDHRSTPPDRLRADTLTALETLERAAISPTSWRLPWGREGRTSSELADELGLELVHWDHDTHDWRGDRWADQPLSFRNDVARGGIVLLHDALGPGAKRSGCTNTLELIDRIALSHA